MEEMHLSGRGGRGCLTRFGNLMEKQHCPKLDHPDIRGRQNFERSMVPLRLHGDGCCITGRSRVWNKTADIFSWSSCIGKGKTKDLMYFIWCLYQVQRCTLDGHKTLDNFSKKLKWSFQALWRGTCTVNDLCVIQKHIRV